MTIREKIKRANDRPLHEVDVPEWECKVLLRVGSAYEMIPVLDRIQKNAKSGRKDPYHIPWVLSQFLCEEDGSLAYKGEEYKELADRSFVVVGRLFRDALRVNGLLEDEEDEAEIEKKLETEESDSGSDYLSD